MKLEELEDFVESNSEMDIDLERASRELPQIQSKAILYKVQEQTILKSLILQLDTLMKDKWMHYSGKHTAEHYKKHPFDLKVMREDMPKFLNADEDIQKMKSRISMQELKIELLEEFLKSLNQRSYQIRSIIDVQKMQKGLI